MLSSLKQQQSPRAGSPPDAAAAAPAAGGGGFSGVERSVGSGGGAPPPLTTLDDQQGQPVKVQVSEGLWVGGGIGRAAHRGRRLEVHAHACAGARRTSHHQAAPCAPAPAWSAAARPPIMTRCYHAVLCCAVLCCATQVYRKSFKEFTDLRLVQQLGGHTGVVWALKFSRNGRFLASGARARLPV